MEIERKFLVNIQQLQLTDYPFRIIEQGYLCKEPVVRVRRDNDNYYLTYKSKGLMVRQEENLPLTKESYTHLIKKADGSIIRKCRYLIPYSYNPQGSANPCQNCTIELDVFEDDLEGLILAEVEFASVNDANTFVAPHWFLIDVTTNPAYQNSNLTDGLPRNV